MSAAKYKSKIKAIAKTRVGSTFSAKAKTKTLSQVLKEARESKGLSQSDVSKLFGYGSAQFISNIERGLANPPLKIISKLVALYDLDADHVLSLMVSDYSAKVESALSMAKVKNK